ncbi:MAG: glycogen debranching protein GlgX [Hyphomicrobiales bacterium]
MNPRLSTGGGTHGPPGVSLRDGGVNVSVVSRHGERIHFCLFDERGERETLRFALPQRLGDIHFGFIEGVTEGMRYGLRAEGPWQSSAGHRFDMAKLLIDPYASRIDRPFVQRPELAERGRDTAALVPKCIVTGPCETATPLPPFTPGLIYEIPVKAFSKLHPGVPVALRGTVAALAEPAVIAHLHKLGADTVELLPLAAWIDERHLPPLGLGNAWGYNPVSFMAPDPRLAPGGLAEIRTAVETLHRAGIRVILDVVFNHTGESYEQGATLSLRGLDNALYYAHEDGRLVNHTGCGNTLALDRAPVVQLVMDAMRLWATCCGIDGFRFDLATVMGRTTTGFSPAAPLFAAIAHDPLLSKLTMIAEPWDLGEGGYRLGQFPPRWLEWNDRYRDDVRRFWRGDRFSSGALATRLAGSSDIFAPRRMPSRSVNFLAAHDGFALKDAVTYRVKDNWANGEGNRDGKTDEVTWPGGDIRALLATLFVSRGTPMLTAGDEFGRSQRGNNNAYAQDNETTWLDWSRADAGLIEFTASLAQLRKAHPLLTDDRFLTGVSAGVADLPDAIWLGGDGRPMDWHGKDTRVLGLVLASEDERIAIWINGLPEDRDMPPMPPRDGFAWSLVFCQASGNGLPAHSVSVFAEERRRRAGISDATLAELAEAAGIEREFWEVDGTHHRVLPDTLRIILSGLGLAHATPEEAQASRRRLDQTTRPVLARMGESALLRGSIDARRRVHVALEDGGMLQFEFAPGQAAAVPGLPMGRHRAWSEATRDLGATIIVSPGTCHLPQRLIEGARDFGFATHLYGLRHGGDGGIGTLETLRRFAEMSQAQGGKLAGINPLHHLFPADRSRASPYQPSDRRFIDPIYIDIAALLAEFPLPKARRQAETRRAALARLEELRFIDYPEVWKEKSALLEAAFAEFPGDARLAAFIREGGAMLARHGAFEVRQAGEHADDGQRIRYRAFLQWAAEAQLAKAAERRNIYRDLALGTAFDGGEMWERPEFFAQGVSLGAPPDPFARQGQVWNLPPFSPLALADTGFQGIADILRANMRHAAALRIDHILGFARQFWVPRGADAGTGAYVRFPAEILIALTAIESRRNACMIVGEDLGTIPDGLREALAAADILSYRVLWFERDGIEFKPPTTYPRLALACLASHDLPTFMGWRLGRDIEIGAGLGHLTEAAAAERRTIRRQEIEALERATGAQDGAAAATHAFLARSPSVMMSIQAGDLAGEIEPLNVPGTDTERPNWRRRLSRPVEKLMEEPMAQSILAAVKRERPQ